MIRINLLQEAKSKKGKGPKVSVASAPGAPPAILVPVGIGIILLVAAVLGYMYFSAKSAYEKQKADNDRVEALVKSLQHYLDDAKKLETQKVEVESRINQIKALKSQQQGPVYLMTRLFETKPDEGVWFLEIRVDDPQVAASAAPTATAAPAAAPAVSATPAALPPSIVHIKGVGKNQTIVTQFVTELERRKDWFPSVTLKAIKATSGNSEAGLDGREFDLDVSFVPPSSSAPGKTAAGVK
jgi:Tfp pilus assembly protein PilN